MTAQQLKNSILQMAVQGKLVPQDPNDEPASVLLERIRTEKEQLIKEKKIKREKNPSVIFKGADNTVYGVETLFLFYFLMSQRTAFIKRGEGGAQPNISKEKIVTTLMPLPPLAEQHRIVQRIEELLPLVKGL